MASEPKDYAIFFILTSNTEATENKVEFLNYACTVKGSAIVTTLCNCLN